MKLVDPDTRQPVSRASASELESLRARVAAGSAKRPDGAEIPAFDAAYLTPSRRVAYLVEDGLPNFVISERVELDAPL